MVSRTLEYFREGRDAEPTVRTDLAAILQTLADDAAGAGPQVAYHGPAHAVPPLRRLAAKPAFGNLLNNALQHGAPPVTLSLLAGTAGTAGTAGAADVADVAGVAGGWVVEVTDAGHGIPAEAFSRALSPFARLDPARGGTGVGLGLTIAHRFTAAEGGALALALALARAEAGGSLVRVALPG